MTSLWEIARISGLLLFATSTVVVVLGAAATRRASGQGRLVLALVHRSAALLTVALLVAHVTAIVVDSYVDVSPLGALVPFASGYSPFAVGLGSLALWCIAVLVATGLARARFAASARAARSWRGVHLVAWLMWPLALAHGLLVGTDSGSAWAWPIYAACAVAVALAAAARLRELRRTDGIAAIRGRALAAAGAGGWR